MGCNFLFTFTTFCLLISLISCVRILVVLPTPLYSHNLVYRTIYKELSLRGHEIVAFTPDPIKDPKLTNIKEIDMSFLYKHPELEEEGSLLKLTTEVFSHPEMKRIANDTNERFDLIIVEWSVNPSFSVLSKRFDCPLIGMRAKGLGLEGHDSIGNPTNPSYIPSGYRDFEQNFWGRLDNFLFGVLWRLHYHLFVVPEAQRIADEFFPNYSKNNILEIEKNVSIVLTNTHPVITGVRPIVPATVEVGGIHLKKEPKEIPKNIQDYLDNAKEGVVYVNLGAKIKSSTIDPVTLKLFISALSELPYKVVWKWEKDDLPKPPLNVKIFNWLPQETILGHPNTKAIITNGGLQSFLEAVDNHVPLVGIPFAADQFINARQMEKLKIGKMLNIKNLKKRTLMNAVKNVIQNPKYKKNIKYIAVLLHDLPMKPLDKAVWWIEYVLRHKGARHLRSPAVDLDWITYLLLDVIAFFIVCIITVITVIYYILLYLWRLCKLLRGKTVKEKVN